jgi:hypothetical protein
VVESGRWHGLRGASGYPSTPRLNRGPTHYSRTTAETVRALGQGALGGARMACSPTKESSRFTARRMSTATVPVADTTEPPNRTATAPQPRPPQPTARLGLPASVLVPRAISTQARSPSLARLRHRAPAGLRLSIRRTTGPRAARAVLRACCEQGKGRVRCGRGAVGWDRKGRRSRVGPKGAARSRSVATQAPQSSGASRGAQGASGRERVGAFCVVGVRFALSSSLWDPSMRVRVWSGRTGESSRQPETRAA